MFFVADSYVEDVVNVGQLNDIKVNLDFQPSAPVI
jgi:hypothetical protein